MDYKYTRYTLEKRLMENKEEEKSHPQKELLKTVCDIVFYIGGGNFWYEDRNLTRKQQFFYNIYATMWNVFLFGNTFNELLANLRPNLNSREQNDLVQFTIAHSHVCFKIAVFYMTRGRIKIFIKRFCEERRFARLDLDINSVRKAKWYSISLSLTSYSAIFAAAVVGIKMYIKYGIPIRTEILLYPTAAESGFWINVLRTILEVHWWYLVTMMACVDSLCACCLVFVGYRFKTLSEYFKSLRPKYLQRSGEDLQTLENDFTKDFLAGIKFHKETLWSSYYVQYSLGYLYSIQITETVLLLVMCLVKLVAERSLTNFFANFTYILCLVALSGAYMLSAGDVMFEAEKVPLAIFQSGWEFTQASKQLRTLMVVTLTRSQRPVYMTAFGILILSYSNFISMLRISYSFFAILY